MTIGRHVYGDRFLYTPLKFTPAHFNLYFYIIRLHLWLKHPNFA